MAITKDNLLSFIFEDFLWAVGLAFFTYGLIELSPPNPWKYLILGLVFLLVASGVKGHLLPLK